MSVRHDPKGKYFTEVVSKLQLVVWIQTTRQRIRGTVHLLPDQRLSDHLNQAHEFLAVTDVTIYEEDREWKSAFLAVRSSQVIWVTPEGDMEKTPGAGGSVG